MDEVESEEPRVIFHRIFTAEIKELEERVSRLSSTRASDRQTEIDGVLTAIGARTHDLKDASNYLPAYDQKAYSEQLKAVSDQLSSARNALAPRAKFSFKNRRTTGAGSSSAAVPPKPAVSSVHAGTAGGPEIAASEKVSSVADRTSAYLVASPATEETTILSLSSLAGCLVKSKDTKTKFTNLAIKNVTSSVLVCGEIDGPAHITSLNKSVLVVKCKQFRLHDSEHLDVYLSCNSRPIIERCKNIRFARLPGAFGGDGGEMWREVDDFNWLKEGKPSPNWRVMEEEEKEAAEREWEELVEREYEGPLQQEDQERLRAVLPG